MPKAALMLLILAAAKPAVEKPKATTFTLDSTSSTYPFVLRLEGTATLKHDSLEIIVESGTVRSSIPEEVGSEGLATNVQITVGLGKQTDNGWVMDIEAPQQFIAMKLAPGEGHSVSRRTFIIHNTKKLDLANRWLAARLTVNQALPGVQPGNLSSYACSEENLLGATAASRERAEAMRTAYSHTC